jgi:hypothetical protein
MVELSTSKPGYTLQGGANGMIIRANSTAEAKAFAKAVLGFDVDAPWAGATVTAIADPTDWADPTIWGFRVIISNPTTGAEVERVEVYSDSSNDTIDEIAALLVTALNATASIAGAAYNTGTQVLTIAETTDTLGDMRVDLFSWPVISGQEERKDLLIGTFFGAITDEGMSSAALSVTLGADALVPPMIYRTYKIVA